VNNGKEDSESASTRGADPLEEPGLTTDLGTAWVFPAAA
jgi:hypothetical protein